MRPLLFLLALPLLASVVLACGNGAQDEAERTATPVPTPTDYAAIRDADLVSAPGTEALLAQLGSGRVALETVLYADLTGDLREEAVVPITADGTLGNIAYAVFALRSGTLEVILTRTMDRTTASGLVMSIDDFGALQETIGVYGPADPLCCPSQLRLTTFRWDGTRLQVAGEQLQENPDKAKE